MAKFFAPHACYFLPQICHKPKRAESENGGFLRVTADRLLWQQSPLHLILESNFRLSI